MLNRKGTMVHSDIISVESALSYFDDAIAYCESTCLTDEQINNLNDPDGEQYALNCLQPLWRRAGQWIRKKMTGLANTLTSCFR